MVYASSPANHSSESTCHVCFQQLLLQILVKKDGYANQPETKHAEESEELLAPLREPVSSNTIAELCSVSQVLAPNSIDAEMQSVSLHTPDSPAAGGDWHKHDEEDENSDPNQVASTRRNASHVEMQPLQDKKGGSFEGTDCRRRQVHPAVHSAVCLATQCLSGNQVVLTGSTCMHTHPSQALHSHRTLSHTFLVLHSEYLTHLCMLPGHCKMQSRAWYQSTIWCHACFGLVRSLHGTGLCMFIVSGCLHLCRKA